MQTDLLMTPTRQTGATSSSRHVLTDTFCLQQEGMRVLCVTGSDKSHRNVLLIPNARALINNISAYTVGISWNMSWFMGIKYFNCDRQLSGGKATLGGDHVTRGGSKNSPRKCRMLSRWSDWWYDNLQIMSTVRCQSSPQVWMTLRSIFNNFDTTFSPAGFGIWNRLSSGNENMHSQK